jgi:hypothetical protein
MWLVALCNTEPTPDDKTATMHPALRAALAGLDKKQFAAMLTTDAELRAAATAVDEVALAARLVVLRAAKDGGTPVKAPATGKKAN